MAAPLTAGCYLKNLSDFETVLRQKMEMQQMQEYQEKLKYLEDLVERHPGGPVSLNPSALGSHAYKDVVQQQSPNPVVLLLPKP